MRSVENKVVVITGASRGIGAAIARHFAKAKAKVVMCARHLEDLEKAARDLEAPESDLLVIPADVGTADGMRRVVDETIEKFEQIDYFINNAGIGLRKPVVETSEEDFDRMFDTNVKAIFLSFQKVLPRMLKRGQGHIINVSSLAAKGNPPQMSIYAASKAAVNSMSDAVGSEVRAEGIKVSVLSPASTDTRMLDRVSSGTSGIKRLTPDEVAEAVMYLATQNENAWTSSVDIRPLYVKK
jgi:NADP-dependent 3-hydroxy acid dehydrogenase YdfG